jgi:hypothetical protein
MTTAKIARRLVPVFGAITVLAFAAPDATQASTSSRAHVSAGAVAGSAARATTSSPAVRAGAATRHHYSWKVMIRHHKVTRVQQGCDCPRGPAAFQRQFVRRDEPHE